MSAMKRFHEEERATLQPVDDASAEGAACHTASPDSAAAREERDPLYAAGIRTGSGEPFDADRALATLRRIGNDTTESPEQQRLNLERFMDAMNEGLSEDMKIFPER